MRRVAGALALLALAGLAISTYLGAFQLGVIDAVWDPFFGTGSERVLTSGISRALPVPDGLIGAGGYALEAILAAALAFDVGGRRPVSLLLTVVALGGALASLVLVASQPIVVGTFCTLCLASAAISIVLAAGAVTEWRPEREAETAGFTRRHAGKETFGRAIRARTVEGPK